MAQWYGDHNIEVIPLDCRASWWARAWPALAAFHPNRDIWWRRRWEKGLFSPAAWDRHTRINGRLLDAAMRPGSKILQMAKEYFPHPRYQEMEYYVFINYNARLSRDDGFTPWRPAPKHEEAFIRREDLLFQHATHVFTAGEYLRKNLIEESGVRPERVTTVGNGVNPYYLQNPPPSFPETFSHRLLFVGWDLGLKGGGDVLRALPAIRARYPQVELNVVGPDEAQRTQQGMWADVPGVRWMGNQRVTLDQYREADLLVLPSLRDSYGFVFMEAMSQGVPCIGSDVNGMPEMIEHGLTGYIVPRQSPDKIAEAICCYYADKANKRHMAERAFRRVHDHFTWDVVMSKVCKSMELVQPVSPAGTHERIISGGPNCRY